MNNKKRQLAEIAKEVAECTICPEGKSGLPVPGEGSADAKVVFIGEAPGKTEAKTGRPFVGRSGKFLREQIRAIGLDEEEVFITSPVKYLPDRGTPTPKDIAHGRMHLFKQLKVIDPEVIVLMGSVAALGVLEEKIPVAKQHGTFIEREGKGYFFMYHPAAAIRFSKWRKVFIEDMKKLGDLISE
jgi:DNA polymerase